MNVLDLPVGAHVMESQAIHRFDVVVNTGQFTIPVAVVLGFDDAVDEAVTAGLELSVPVYVDGQVYLRPEVSA